MKKETFESYIFSVNFGDAELYKKHSPYMKLSYDYQQTKIDQKDAILSEQENRIKELEEELSNYQGMADTHAIRINKQLKEANEVIDFYSDEDLYERDYDFNIGDCTPILHDEGEKAREYQAKYVLSDERKKNKGDRK